MKRIESSDVVVKMAVCFMKIRLPRASYTRTESERSSYYARILGVMLMRSRKFRLIAVALVSVAIVLVGYWFLRPAQPRTMRHPLTGYVLEVTPEMNRITVRNEEIPGTMVSMVMDYRVRDVAALARIKPGDVIQATMVTDDAYWLEDIRVTGKR
jgi:Cu/Ag efflux protein CusF